MQDQNQSSEPKPQDYSEPPVATALNFQQGGVPTGVPPAPVTSIPPSTAQQVPPFPVGKLLFIIFGPGVLLVASMILQVFRRFIFATVDGGGSTGGGVAGIIINLITLILGAVAVIGIILMPVSIILLVVRYNKKKNQ